MKNIAIAIAVALLATSFASGSAQAGIFGHRWRQPASGYGYGSYPQQPTTYAQQPSTAYRSYSQQPRANDFPFSSRADPRDWKEAHRGYGVKIRGW